MKNILSIQQVVRHWTEIYNSFVGDFCQSGHNQILVLLSNGRTSLLVDYRKCKNMH